MSVIQDFGKVYDVSIGYRVIFGIDYSGTTCMNHCVEKSWNRIARFPERLRT